MEVHPVESPTTVTGWHAAIGGALTARRMVWELLLCPVIWEVATSSITVESPVQAVAGTRQPRLTCAESPGARVWIQGAGGEHQPSVSVTEAGKPFKHGEE